MVVFICGARNEGLSPHKADLYKALLKCTVNRSSILKRSAISVGRYSLIFTMIIHAKQDLRIRTTKISIPQKQSSIHVYFGT